MFKLLNRLLICCLVYHIRTASLEIITVSGKKGGNVTLPCDFQNKTIYQTELISKSEEIPLCETKPCSGRHYKEGACDVVITNLTFSDAKTYISRVFPSSHQDQPLQSTEKTFQLQIHDEIIVKIGRQLVLDILLSNAGKVEKKFNGKWTEVWTRAHGVWSDRLTESDGNLTIKAFIASDAGQYRVLEIEGEPLITLTVRASPESTESGPKENQSAGQQKSHKVTLTVGVVIIIIIIIIMIVVFYIWYKRCKKENKPREENPVELEDLHQS